MTPFDLLRRYFAATGIGHVPSRMGVVDGLAQSVVRSFPNRRVFGCPVPDLSGLQEAKEWAHQIWQDVGDASLHTSERNG